MERNRWALAGLATAAVLAGCSSTPASTLSDPTEIVVTAVQELRATATVHVEAHLSGELSGGPEGTGGTLRLDGMSLSGDLDLASRAASLKGSAPALMDAQGDLIVVGGVRYLKLNLLGDRWYRLPSTTEPPAPSPSRAASELLAGLREALQHLSSPPERLADEGCGGVTCFHVRLRLTAADLAGLQGGSPPPVGVEGTASVDLWVRQTDLRPAKVIVAITGAGAGARTMTATVVLSDFDRPVTISPPPAEEVVDGAGGLPSPPPFLSLPGFFPPVSP